jgi:hypothetical protein
MSVFAYEVFLRDAADERDELKVCPAYSDAQAEKAADAPAAASVPGLRKYEIL